MSRDDPQMKIRLPADLKARIEQVSAANQRTMNAEIVQRLEQSFDGGEDAAGLRKEVEHLKALLETARHGEEIRGQMGQILATSMRRLLKVVPRKDGEHPEIALGRTLIALTDHGGEGVASLLAELRDEADPMKRVLRSFADFEQSDDIQPVAIQSVDDDGELGRPHVADPSKGSGGYLATAHDVLTKRGLAGLAMTGTPAKPKQKTK